MAGAPSTAGTTFHGADHLNRPPARLNELCHSYILATNMLDEMIDPAKFDKLDTLVTEARALQDRLLAQRSD